MDVLENETLKNKNYETLDNMFSKMLVVTVSVQVESFKMFCSHWISLTMLRDAEET